MAILTTTNLSKSFGPDDIFEGIDLSIPQGAKIALVGPNGAGKTTLIRLLVGLDAPTEGTLNIAKDTRIGYLPQNPVMEGDGTVHDEMLRAFESVIALEAELTRLLDTLDDNPAALEQYGRLQEQFERGGGYTYENTIQQVLGGLGFPPELYDRPLSILSGGQKTRALLARLLLEKPDLLVLDEPTNHLDINAIEWLENYLRAFDGAVLIVSHDRYFMDNVAENIWELEWGGLETYRGNYSHYLRQREERHERRIKDFEAQQEFIAKEQDYIRRNIAGQNTAQAKGRLRRLDRLMASENLVKAPRRRSALHIRLQADGRTGDQVLKAKNLAVGYTTPLFHTPELLLLRGEVAAIIGPNGAGKSTFLKTILGHIPPLSGEYDWGAQVHIGYFAQAHEDLIVENTLLDEILRVENLPVSQARNYLASYLFTGDDVFRKISTLSGGERGRLALAKLALAGANVLLLDEPTNHLDIPAQEVLQDVLSGFEGSILLVSHDRYLVDALATQIWHIAPGQLSLFKGNYAEYLAERRKAAEPESVTLKKEVTSETRRKSRLNPYQRQKQLEAVEIEIATLEATVANITAALESASAEGRVEEVTRLADDYATSQAALDQALAKWAELADDDA